MINESDCSRDFSKEITKKYPDIHITIRNCNEFDNSLDFAKVSIYETFFVVYITLELIARAQSYSVTCTCYRR